jgi:CubicO group peptidase (beta-lactamase class C family)
VNSARVGSLLAELTAEHRVPGAQVALHGTNGTVAAEVGEQAHGVAGAVTAESAFPVGSLTKPFTATMAMMLVADGDVELDAPLAGYLPELGAAAGPRLTLRHVLSHTGGLVSTVDDHGRSSRARWVSRHCREADLVYPPGTVFSYSNAGYVLAGHLVEAVTGMRWAEAVETILLRPLGIAPAFVVGESPRPAVPGHTVGTTVRVVTQQNLPEVEEPAGALALSAVDLVTFGRLHLGDPALPDLLPAGTASEMRRTVGLAVGPAGIADDWTPGWSAYRHGVRTWFGHDGTGTGTSCHLRFEPESGTVLAMTTNANTGLAMWDDLVVRLRAEGVDVGSCSLTSVPDGGAPSTGSADCAGTYRNGATEFDIAVGPDGELYLMVDGVPHSKLTCFDDLRFTMRECDGGRTAQVGRFVRDSSSGRVDLLQVSGRLARRSR